MSKLNIDLVRIWKDADYRESFSAEELAQLPVNPAGLVELSDEELGLASGARPPETGDMLCSISYPTCILACSHNGAC